MNVFRMLVFGVRRTIEEVLAMITPQSMARRAGVLNLLSAIPAGFSVSVLTRFYVRGNPAATAANILGSETLFRAGFASDLIGIALFLAAVLLLYELLRPASETGARLMACFGVLACGIQAQNGLGDLLALMFLKGGASVAAFTPAQQQALAFTFLRLHSTIYTIALVFLGGWALTIAWLIRRATFLPRVLGALEVVEGLGYLAFSLCAFVVPPIASRLVPFVPYVTAGVGELPLYLWLMIRTVDAERWRDQARAAAQAVAAAHA